MLTKEILKNSEKGIDKSDTFIALVTENFLKDERPLYEWRYAKLKNKPFVLVIKKGTKIPEEMKKGVNIVYECYFSDEKELEEESKKLGEFLKESKC